MNRSKPGQAGGFVLIEALVSITIFSFALIGLVGLQAASIAAATEAKNRSDASYLSNQIIGQMWSDRPNILSYNHCNTGIPCQLKADPTINPAVSDWLAQVTSTLPGAQSNMQTLAVTADNTVTVVISWKQAQEVTYHQQTTIAQIN